MGSTSVGEYQVILLQPQAIFLLDPADADPFPLLVILPVRLGVLARRAEWQDMRYLSGAAAEQGRLRRRTIGGKAGKGYRSRMVLLAVAG